MDRSFQFEWDNEKNARCMAERGFGFSYVIRIFAGDVLECQDMRCDYKEVRIQAVGRIAGQPFMVVYTRRGDVMRIISARKMHEKEWRKWQK